MNLTPSKNSPKNLSFPWTRNEPKVVFWHLNLFAVVNYMPITSFSPKENKNTLPNIWYLNISFRKSLANKNTMGYYSSRMLWYCMNFFVHAWLHFSLLSCHQCCCLYLVYWLQLTLWVCMDASVNATCRMRI